MLMNFNEWVDDLFHKGSQCVFQWVHKIVGIIDTPIFHRVIQPCEARARVLLMSYV